jgi:hypothetical protein
LLSDAHSIDWRSLTFTGERHLIELRVPGPDSRPIVNRMCAGLEDTEFSIPGVIVADIAIAGTGDHCPEQRGCGSGHGNPVHCPASR